VAAEAHGAAHGSIVVDLSGCGLIALGRCAPAAPVDAGWMSRIGTLKVSEAAACA
jgi:hypothetical protein